MSRRRSFTQRIIPADYKYNSVFISKIINAIMKDGKKSVARKITYKAMDIIASKSSRKPLEVLEDAISNITPSMEVRSRRAGGSTYQVPIEVSKRRKTTLTIRWIKKPSISRKEKTFYERLANEIIDASYNKGEAVKTKENNHAMAESNRTFSHYRW